jgi:ABC-type Na+ efflux pump permease subunit
MLDRIPPELLFFGKIMGVAMLISLALAAALLALTYRRLKQLRIPPGADFFTTLRRVPLTLVLFLDLLDFGLDFFSVPVAWVVLSRLGLQSLRGVTVVEEIIPGTQFLPTMTAAWLAARLLPRS